MENETSTPDGGESTLNRLEAFLSAEEPSEEHSDPQEIEERADEPAPEPEEVDADKQDGETPEYQLADVAKMLGTDETALDVDDDGSVLVKTKIDGQEGKVKFSDLVKSYQLQGHVDKQVREAAEIRKQAQEFAAQYQQQIQVQQVVVDKIAEAKVIEQQLAQYQGINWQKLEDDDPVQAMRLQRQMGELKQAYQSKVAEVNQAQQYIEHQKAQAVSASLENERQALMHALPEWGNEAVAVKEKQSIAADLRARGFADKDINELSDHRILLMARDAMLYRQGKAASNATEKQVRAAPKIVKPGSTSQKNTSALQKIHQEVKRTGSKQSVVQYLLASNKV